jgi:ankyrin repeat protein
MGASQAKLDQELINELSKYPCDLKVVSKLVKNGANPYAKCNRSFNSFEMAIVRDKKKIIQIFLKSGIDPNKKFKNGNFPLMRACYYNYTSNIVKILLKCPNINVNQQNSEGNTALIIASYGNNIKLVRVLLRAGADAAIKNNMGRTALMNASIEPTILTKNQIKTVKLLNCANLIPLFMKKRYALPYDILRESIAYI